MALKDLLLYADATEQSEARLRLGAEIARHQRCRLIVLFVKDRSIMQMARRKAAEIGLAPAKDVDKLDHLFETANDAAAERIHALLSEVQAAGPLDAEWRCVTGSAADIVPQHARAADLCIVGQDMPDSEDLPPGHALMEQFLFAAGRPVLLVPAKGRFETAGRNILVAWNGSRPAARVVNDALPILVNADRATLLVVNKADVLGRYGALPPTEILEHLRRHGVRIEAETIETRGAIADVLQDRAEALGADLIVAGAYGHSRLRERLLGGVTQNLLAQMRLPLLMSH